MHSIRQINSAIGNSDDAERDRDRSHRGVQCHGVALSYPLAVDHSKSWVAERDCAHAQEVGIYLHDYRRGRGNRMRRIGNATSCGVHQLANRSRFTVANVVPAEDPAGYRDKKNTSEYSHEYRAAISTKKSDPFITNPERSPPGAALSLISGTTELSNRGAGILFGIRCT